MILLISVELPKSIKPCPIIEALVEIRFNPSIPNEAVFGAIFTSFREKFAKPEALNILQIPDVIRNSDPNLRIQPHYKLQHDDYSLSVGPEVFTFSMGPEYAGWEIFYQEIQTVLNDIGKLNIIEKISRIGVRYINFFENGILNKIKIGIDWENTIFNPKTSNYRFEIESENCINTLQIIEPAILESKTPQGIKTMNGAVIDIDSFTGVMDNSKDMDWVIDVINQNHLEEKKVFFNLLKEEYIMELNPKY